MTKRQRDGYTILNSKNTLQEVERKLCTMLQKVWQFSFSEEGNHKSSAKTDELHEKWEKVVYASFGDFEDKFKNLFELETEKAKFCGTTHKISDLRDMYEQKFNVDLMMKFQGQPHTAFLLKAPLTSINKNRYNYISNLLGEICRFYGNPDNTHLNLVFVNFIPKTNFLLESDTLRPESTRFIGLTEPDILKSAPLDAAIKSKIKEINIHYELDLDLSQIKSREDLKTSINARHYAQDSFVNILEMQSLKHYVEELIVCHNAELNINLEYTAPMSLSELKSSMMRV